MLGRGTRCGASRKNVIARAGETRERQQERLEATRVRSVSVAPIERKRCGVSGGILLARTRTRRREESASESGCAVGRCRLCQCEGEAPKRQEGELQKERDFPAFPGTTHHYIGGVILSTLPATIAIFRTISFSFLQLFQPK